MRGLFIAVVAVIAASGCVAHERVVVHERPVSPCPAGEWVEGHYGPHGHWHDGHWRCPGAVEVIEVG